MKAGPSSGDDRQGGLRVAALVLAAGAGSRMGGRPKSLLEFDGVALIQRLLTALSHAGVDPVVVVLGHHAEHIAPLVQTFPVTLVRNPRPDEGQVSSLRCGLAAVDAEADAVLVALADQPLVNAQDIGSLISAWEQRPAGREVLVPEVAGEPGNPVMFSAKVREQILAGAAHVGCREWRSAHPDAVQMFRTDNRHFKIDLDTEEDMARFARETGQLLRWPATLLPS